MTPTSTPRRDAKMQDMLKGFNMGGMGGAGGVQMFNGVGRGERDRGFRLQRASLEPPGSLFTHHPPHRLYVVFGVPADPLEPPG